MAEFLNLRDMFDGGGAGASGDQFKGGPFSAILNALGVKPKGYRDRGMGGKADAAEAPAGVPSRSYEPPPRSSYVVPNGPPLGSQPGAPTFQTPSIPMPSDMGMVPDRYTDLFMSDVLNPQSLGTATGDERAVPLMNMPEARVIPAMGPTPQPLPDYATLAEMEARRRRAPAVTTPAGTEMRVNERALRDYLGL